LAWVLEVNPLNNAFHLGFPWPRLYSHIFFILQ
jgi:hypothetical protein